MATVVGGWRGLAVVCHETSRFGPAHMSHAPEGVRRTMMTATRSQSGLGNPDGYSVAISHLKLKFQFKDAPACSG